MKKISLYACFLIAAALSLGMQEAHAKRFGGGSSFGSRPSYSQPYQHETAPNGSNPAYNRPSPAQQQAASQNQTARQNLSNRGGLMGMLGGLALGGLLGSLFFGGAFESLNIMDMLLFGLVAYLVYRLFAARRAPNVADAYGRGAHTTYNGEPATQGGGFNTDVMFKQPAATLPAGFEAQPFLAGAERAFRHMQACWDSRDLASIRGLTTDKVFAEIQEQLRESPVNHTQVVSLRSELLSVSESNGFWEAAVLFQAVISEDGAPAEPVNEVWRFIKPVNSQQPKWFLDGLQQVAG